jgi:hypothetical protein
MADQAWLPRAMRRPVVLARGIATQRRNLARVNRIQNVLDDAASNQRRRQYQRG